MSNVSIGPPATTSTRVVAATALVAGPALLAASTFLWTGGRYGALGGILIALSTPVWTPGLLALWQRVQARWPLAGALGPVLLLLGCAGGVAFGVQGVFEQALGLTGAESVAALDGQPLASTVVYFLLGPAFPVSLVLLGALLAAGRLVDRRAGLLLAAGGVAFPLSRIPRLEAVAHLADLLMLVGSAWLAWIVYRSTSPQEPERTARLARDPSPSGSQERGPVPTVTGSGAVRDAQAPDV